jgi:hypothetical protein
MAWKTAGTVSTFQNVPQPYFLPFEINTPIKHASMKMLPLWMSYEAKICARRNQLKYCIWVSTNGSGLVMNSDDSKQTNNAFWEKFEKKLIGHFLRGAQHGQHDWFWFTSNDVALKRFKTFMDIQTKKLWL